MAAFHFRLQPLLDERLQAQKRAEEELAASQKELLVEKRTCNDLQQEQKRIEDLIVRRRRELVGNVPIGGGELEQRKEDLAALGLHLQSARDAVFSQQIVVDEAEAKLEEARRQTAERSREAETLAKYRGKLETEFLREVARKEELELDEIGNVLYLNRNHAQ
jgi:flagellar biosynthesis chaperone FliJ